MQKSVPICVNLSTRPIAGWSLTGASIISMLVRSQKFFTWCSTFCSIKSNRTSIHVQNEYTCSKSNIHVQKFCYIGTIRFVKHTFSRKLRITIYCGEKVYFMAFVIVNWSTKINLYFLIQFSTKYLAVELLGGKYCSRFLPIVVQGLHSVDLTIGSLFMYRHQKCVTIYIMPRVPGWPACKSSIKAFRKTDATRAHKKIPPLRMNVRVDLL